MRLPALYLKAFRDLWRMRGQALAISLVVASGIAMLVMSQATLDSLRTTRDRMYEDYAYADIWAGLKRAPEHLGRRLDDIEGVASVETGIQSGAKLQLPGFDEPIEALMQSLPDDGTQPRHNRLHLRAGRLPAPFVTDEVVISDAFAKVHQLRPGDRLRVTVYGRSQWLTLVGIAVSPEHLNQAKPTSMFPDYTRYAIVWAPRASLAAALNMSGAFNHLSIRLTPEARGPEAELSVIRAVDQQLGRWGGLGAVGRMEQPAYRILYEELRQLGTMTRLFPVIFLGVAAFLLNVVFSRLIGTQRAQIAILKAFGYSTPQVAWHYALMAILICLLGSVIGLAAGMWLGTQLAGLYQINFHFPYLSFRLNEQVAFIGILVSLLAALAGTGHAVLKAAGEPVAQAMRPVMPERYHRTLAERLGLTAWLSQPARMVLRQLERRPWRAVLSIIGLALAGALLVLARFQVPTITYLVDSQYRLAERYDVAVNFIEAAPTAALHELRSLPGVEQVSGLRTVPVRLSHGSVTKTLSIEGLPADAPLREPVNARLRTVSLPPDGLVISAYLAGQLRVNVGEMLQVEVLQGRRARLQLPVMATVDDFIGVRAYMETTALNRALGEGNLVSGALMTVQRGLERPILHQLDRRPKVISAETRLSAVEAFFDMLDRITGPFTWIGTLMGAIVNFGVVYNSARITLAERARELASLRVLGFTRQEISRILLGEILLLVLISIPLSFVFGWGLSWLLMQGLQSELYRMPNYIPNANYAFAALVTIASTTLSLVAVVRQTRRLDMIEALKSHE
ncbi:MAG: ABC transporter permease [Lautropia sp.]|nr:ABC transporter permease [Lautropia sp.]